MKNLVSKALDFQKKIQRITKIVFAGIDVLDYAITRFTDLDKKQENDGN